ncbi:MAG: endolytic transglycosylase MltG, partial [Bacteroidota bacterium]
MRTFLKLLGLLLVVVVSASSYYLYSAMNTPVEHAKSDQYITVEYGSTPNRVAELLAHEGVIKSSLPLKVYFRFINRQPGLQAGDYLFPSPISPLAAIALLKAGKKRTKPLTIPEGWTRFDIAERIAAQFPSPKYTQAEDVLALMDDTKPIRDIDAAADHLEGYLYPSTYQFAEDVTAEEIIPKLVGQFKEVWQPEWNAVAQQLNRTPREILTIASLIENESKLVTERPLVSSVIYNRLARGIPLGIDATNVYIAKLLDRWDGILHKSDLEID